MDESCKQTLPKEHSKMQMLLLVFIIFIALEPSLPVTLARDVPLNPKEASVSPKGLLQRALPGVGGVGSSPPAATPSLSNPPPPIKANTPPPDLTSNLPTPTESAPSTPTPPASASYPPPPSPTIPDPSKFPSPTSAAAPCSPPVDQNGITVNQIPGCGDGGDSGLSTGAVVGIVVGSLVGAAALATAALLLFVRQRKQKDSFTGDRPFKKPIDSPPPAPPRSNRMATSDVLALDQVVGAASQAYGQIADYVSRVIRSSVLNLDRLQTLKTGARGPQGGRAVLESMVTSVLLSNFERPDFGIRSMKVPPLDSPQRTKFFKAVFETATESTSSDAELAAYEKERCQVLEKVVAQALDVHVGTAHELLFGSRDLVRDFSAAACAAFALHAAAFAIAVPAVRRTAEEGQPIDRRLFRSSSITDSTVGFTVFPAFELGEYTVAQGTVFGGEQA